MPDAAHTELYLCVALVGLGIALFGRRVVGRLALLTTAPWWLAGVVGGSSSAWADDGGRQWLSAALMIAAGFGLLAGPAARAAGAAAGPAAARADGHGRRRGCRDHRGVLLARPAGDDADRLRGGAPRQFLRGLPGGWRRGLFLPVALAAGVVMTALASVQLVAGQRWSELSLLLLLTAIPTALVAFRHPETRPVSLPTAIGCLAGAVLLALPGGLLGPARPRRC